MSGGREYTIDEVRLSVVRARGAEGWTELTKLLNKMVGEKLGMIGLKMLSQEEAELLGFFLGDDYELGVKGC